MLFLVATPIGNLGDISLRALDTLRAVDLVVSEDTRKTGLLLKHFEIKKPQISFHEYNEQNWPPCLLRRQIVPWSPMPAARPFDPGLPWRAPPSRLPAPDRHPGPTALATALVLSACRARFHLRVFPPQIAPGGAFLKWMPVRHTP